jgi:hypothetical protein
VNRIKLYDCNGIFTKQYITKGMCGAEKMIDGTLRKVTFDSMIKVANARGLFIKDQLPALKKFQKAMAMKKLLKVTMDSFEPVPDSEQELQAPALSIASRLAALKGK